MKTELERGVADRARLTRRRFMKDSVAGTVLALGNHFGGDFASSSDPQLSQEPLTEEERRKRVVASWRTVESGFHNGPTVTFEQLDPEQYMEDFRKAHSQVVVVETKSSWGYAYYDTKVGVKHPNLHYDLIARWIEAGHRRGLVVVAYYSGQVDTQSGIRFPYWVGRNADGSASWVSRHFAWCCHNSPYHDYAIGMYREIFSHYDFDGLFIDGLPWPRWLSDPLCYCEWCMKRYERERGESFIKKLDEPKEYGKRLTWFQDSSQRYLDEIYQTVHSLRPGLPIWFNQGDPFDSSAAVVKKAACPYVEPISSPTGLSVGAVVLRDWGGPGPQVGIFWPGYDATPLEVDQFRTAAVLLQGVRPRFITDQQNMPDGRQRSGFYDWCCHLQGLVEKVEPLLQHLEPITSLGVLFSEATKDSLATRKREVHIGPQDFRDSIIGCLEILARTQYPTGIIPDRELNSDHLQRYDLIALPECDALSDGQGQALKNYVNQGGKLLASWKPGLISADGKERPNFLLADILGVSYVEEVTKYAGKDGPGIYLHSTGHPLSKSLGSGMVAILDASGKRDPAFCPFVSVHGPAEDLADYRLPYLVPNLDKHIFDSWDPAPPGNTLVPQAATFHRFARGETVYLGLPLFRRYHPELYWIDRFVRGIIRQLVPDPSIRAEGDIGIQVSFFRQGPDRVIVQLLNSSVWTSKCRSSASPSVEIIGRKDKFSVRSAKILWPQIRTLAIVGRGHLWNVRVPDVSLYTIVEIQLT